MGDDDPDLELIRALQGGNDSALDELMTRHQEPIHRFIRNHVFNEEDARDLTRETFVRVYFNAAKFKPQAKFATWLYRIALNLCRDHAKSKHTRQTALTESIASWAPDERGANRDLPDPSARTPSDELLTKEKLAALEKGLASLPHDLREALVLTSIEDRSHKECAEILQITPKAVETRVYRARKHLLEWLTGAGFLFLAISWFS